MPAPHRGLIARQTQSGTSWLYGHLLIAIITAATDRFHGKLGHTVGGSKASESALARDSHLLHQQKGLLELERFVHLFAHWRQSNSCESCPISLMHNGFRIRRHTLGFQPSLLGYTCIRARCTCNAVAVLPSSWLQARVCRSDITLEIAQ